MNGKRMVWLAVVASALLAACGAFAEPIAWVPVGGAPNVADDTTYGAVAYEYRISKYEITAGQYTEFLNAKAASADPYGLYDTNMWWSPYGCKIQQTDLGGSYSYSVAADRANRPVDWVSFWDAARFANWMHNGQGSGDTETGAYINIGNQTTFARQPGALFFIPTEDEWYKAAYFDPNKGGPGVPGYWEYPTMSDTAPTSEAPPGGSNSANFDYDAVGSTNVVGAYTGSPGPYGTFDQGGNVWEWDESVVYTIFRGIRGGSWSEDAFGLSASRRWVGNPSSEGYGFGFRLAGSPEMAAVPEPATVSFFACIAVAAMLRRKRRKA